MEIIAHMFEAFAVGGKREAAMKKYFPNAYEYFLKTIGDLL